MTKRTYTFKNKHGRNIAMALRPYKDDRTTSMNTCFIRAKAQAAFRGEEWNLTFEEYFNMWDEHYDQKGRGREDYSWTRIDPDAPWETSNIMIAKRSEIVIFNNTRKTIYEFATPKGIFRTQNEAAKAYNVPIGHMRKWAQLWPDKYYYTKDKK